MGFFFSAADEFNQSINSIKSTFEEIKKFDLNSLFSSFFELDDSARDVAASFGQGAEFLGQIKVALTDNIRGVMGLGGSWSDVVEQQKQYSDALGRNVILSSDLSEDLYAAQSVMGTTTSQIVKSFKDIGYDARNAVKEMQGILDSARQMGVSARETFTQVNNNLTKMNEINFQGGVEGMAKMAAQAVSLRINMSSALKVATDLLSPERAIEMAASLQRLGVVQSDLLDPLRLMDLGQNDPAELQNQMIKMSEQFVHMSAAGRFEILPGAKRQMNEIAKEIGISSDELAKMAIGSAELNKKMQEISFPSDIVDEEEKKFIANMAEIGKTGKYEVSFISKDEGGAYKEVTKAISELTEEDRKELKKTMDPKPMEKIAADQLGTSKLLLSQVEMQTQILKKGLLGGETMTQTNQLMRGVTKAVSEGFSTDGAKFSRQFGEMGATEGLEGVMSLATSITSGGNLFDNLEKFLLGGGGGGFADMMDLLQRQGDLIEKSITKNVENYQAGLPPDQLKRLEDFSKLIGGGLMGNDVKITLNPEDTIHLNQNEINAGTDLYGNTPPPQQMNSLSEMRIDFNLNLTSNSPNINTDSLKEVMRQEGFRQMVMDTITKAVKDGKSGQIGNAVTV